MVEDALNSRQLAKFSKGAIGQRLVSTTIQANPTRKRC
jgi:hypothetical protein